MCRRALGGVLPGLLGFPLLCAADRRDVPGGELGQGLGDRLVPLGGGVLVAQRGADGEMAEAGHQFGERGPGDGGEHGSGMPQVMEPEVWPPGRVARLIMGWETPNASPSSD